MNTSLEQIANVVNGNKYFSIYIHVHTDIDAIGSALSLKRGLEKLGKVAHVFADSTFPDNAYAFEDTSKINNEILKEYDVAFILDCGDENRIGRLKYKYRKNVKTTIQLDHHLDNPLFAKYNYVDTKVSSTCEIMYAFLRVLGIEFDREICRMLISGIYTDSGCLKFSNTYSTTLNIVGKLLEVSGYSMDEITFPLFNNISMQAFNLKKLAHNRVELYEENQIALITITAKDFKDLNVAFDETKGLTDIAMQIGSVKIVALISESQDELGVYYISYRTKGKYNAKIIAETFGGGGHIQAAGCKIINDLNNVKAMVLKAVIEELNR